MVDTVTSKDTDNIIRSTNNVTDLLCSELWYRETKRGSPFWGYTQTEERGANGLMMFQLVTFQLSTAHPGGKTSSSAASILVISVGKPFSLRISEVTNGLIAFGGKPLPLSCCCHHQEDKGQSRRRVDSIL